MEQYIPLVIAVLIEGIALCIFDALKLSRCGHSMILCEDLLVIKSVPRKTDDSSLAWVRSAWFVNPSVTFGLGLVQPSKILHFSFGLY